jgi:hypothetical protein
MTILFGNNNEAEKQAAEKTEAVEEQPIQAHSAAPAASERKANFPNWDILPPDNLVINVRSGK